MKNSKYSLIQLSFVIFISLIMIDCNRSEGNVDYGNSIDTLKVVTLYGPTSYFDYRGEPMGIDYENVRRFAEDENMVLQIKTVANIKELIENLSNGEAHMAAYPVPYISEYKEEILHCGHMEITNQVLVQKKGADQLKDVTDLIGKDLYVEKNSKYHYRLENLNEELGGGINIIPLDSDTITSEDFLHLVSSGDIDYAVVDSDIAALYASAFPDIDTNLRLSSDQASSWAVALGLDSLAAKIDRWENRNHHSEFVKEIYKRYYDRSLNEEFDINLSYFKKIDLANGKAISNYDNIFKKYSGTAGYDWKLLAAIAFCESRFNPSVESRFGAKGLMQVMPNTSLAIGVDPGTLANPDNNVKAAAKILAKLDKSLESKVENPEERMKFVVASYNSGLGHIYDAMALAEKTGLDPQKWTGNVSVSALMKSRPEYYNDPVVKHGYFRGRETTEFVDHVMSIYSYLQSNLSS